MITFGPVGAVAKPGDAAAAHVHDEELGLAITGAIEQQSLAIGRPDRIKFVDVVMRELGNVAAIRIHGEDLEVAVAAAVERNRAMEAITWRSVEPRGSCRGGPKRQAGLATSTEEKN